MPPAFIVLFCPLTNGILLVYAMIPRCNIMSSYCLRGIKAMMLFYLPEMQRCISVGTRLIASLPSTPEEITCARVPQLMTMTYDGNMPYGM